MRSIHKIHPRRFLLALIDLGAIGRSLLLEEPSNGITDKRANGAKQGREEGKDVPGPVAEEGD